MLRIYPGYILGVLFAAASCGQYLQQFTDEDKDLTISVTSDTSSNPVFNPVTRIVSMTLSFSVDRNGSYRILHAADCSGNIVAGGCNTSGALVKNSSIAASITLSYDNILVYGYNVTLCAADTASYKTASITKNFSAGLSTVLTALPTQYNETYGGGGGNLDTGASAEFYLFQSSWTGGSANRGGGVAQDGASNPYSHGAYIDPNDAYKLKYIVVDRGNHRVLIFNQMPTGSTSNPDVVVGQANFTSNSANAGAAIGPQGFDNPVHASVSASGILFVTDYTNHRVLGYNTIPTSNGASANFALGQSSTAGAPTLNSFGAGDARNLNHPYATHAISGKLYIVDQDNQRIVVHNSIPTSTGAVADFVIGQANFTGITTGGADYRAAFGNVSNYLSSPYDLLVYSNRLYVSDTGHHRVLVFTSVPAASDARPNFVIGHTDATFVLPNKGGGVSSTGLNFPTTVVAQNNKLAVADQVNHRIVFYDLPITADDTAAQQVLGQVGLASNSSGTTQTTFNLVKGLIFDNGYIWAADGGNNRAKVLQLPY